MARLKDLQRRPRILYERNPLAEVVAAVNFPIQLAIAEKIPVAFQEEFKSIYPLMKISKTAFSFAVGIVEGQRSVQPFPHDQPLPSYLLASLDEKYLVSFAPGLLALTTTAYVCWEEFSARFYKLLDALFRIYNIPMISRAGLRYKDVIDRESLELGHKPWTDLINLELLKPFTFFSDNLEDAPAFSASTVLDLSGGKVSINYGFVSNVDRKIGFLIDTDCYADNQSFGTASDVKRAFEGFHSHTSLVFGAAISNELHTALRPSSHPSPATT